MNTQGCRALDPAALDLHWRAANYLSVGQIYLVDNPLLSQPLAADHVKRRLLGHWGTTPGINNARCSTCVVTTAEHLTIARERRACLSRTST